MQLKFLETLNFFQVPCVQNSSNPVARGSSPPCFAKCVINIQSSTIKNTKTPSEGANYLLYAFIIYFCTVDRGFELIPQSICVFGAQQAAAIYPHTHTHPN